MPPRTLASLAQALSVAPDIENALVALADALAEVDRVAQLALLRFDPKRDLFTEGLVVRGGMVERRRIDTTFDHLPPSVRPRVLTGAEFVDLGDRSPEYANLFGLPPIADGGTFALHGLRLEGALAGAIALHESKRFFGARTTERFAPSVSLFDLAHARFLERDGRQEAGRTLEDVMQRVHVEYDRRLANVQGELVRAREAAGAVSPEDAARLLTLERETANLGEELRRSRKRETSFEEQVTAAVAQLEQAHVELHRRSEALRQRTRTLWLIDRMLTLDSTTAEPRQLADGLLNLVGEDVQAQRCSLMLVDPDNGMLYLAAFRGLAPNVEVGMRVPVGTGVAGRVAQSRTPLLVQDVSEAQSHPLLHDQFFTTGSFISAPLEYRGELVGVLNVTNRARRGVFVEEDVDRVRLLALVTSLIAAHSRLPERLLQTLTAT